MNKIILLFLVICLFLPNVTLAQNEPKKNRAVKAKENVNYDSKWGLFINTFSLLEPQQAAIGAGINYKIAWRWDVSAEINYLFDGFCQGCDDYQSNGFRSIFTLKRFSKNGIFFYGLDSRIKYFSFQDKQSFVNNLTQDTLHNFSHHASNTLFGIAGIVGFRLPISKNKKWAFEINTGYGIKYRSVNRKNIPDGYKFYRNVQMKKDYNFTSEQDISSWDNIYFPTAWRVIFLF